MTIHEDFSALPALLGGLLIGLSALGLLTFRGKVAGISGMVKGLLTMNTPDKLWRGIFLLGIILGGAIYFSLLKAGPSPLELQGSFGLYIMGGLFVGFGAGIGNGCTSGHGVCGISRGSIRSITATLIFMGTGFLMTFLIHSTVI